MYQRFRQNFRVFPIICFLLVLTFFTFSNVKAAVAYNDINPAYTPKVIKQNSTNQVVAFSNHDTLNGMKFDGYVNYYAYMMDEQLSNEIFDNVATLQAGGGTEIVSKVKAQVKSGKTETHRQQKLAFKKGQNITIWVGLPIKMCKNSDRKVVFLLLRAFYDNANVKKSEEKVLVGSDCATLRKWFSYDGSANVNYDLGMYMPKDNSSSSSGPVDKPINVLVMSMDPSITDADITSKYTPQVKKVLLNMAAVKGNTEYTNAFGVYECLSQYCKYQANGGNLDNITLLAPTWADLIVGITKDGASSSVLNNSCPSISTQKLVIRTRPIDSDILHEFGHAFACLRHEGDWAGEDPSTNSNCRKAPTANTCYWGNSNITYNLSGCLGDKSVMSGAGNDFCEAEQTLIQTMIDIYLGKRKPEDLTGGSTNNSNTSQANNGNTSQSQQSNTNSQNNNGGSTTPSTCKTSIGMVGSTTNRAWIYSKLTKNDIVAIYPENASLTSLVANASRLAMVVYHSSGRQDDPESTLAKFGNNYEIVGYNLEGQMSESTEVKKTKSVAELAKSKDKSYMFGPNIDDLVNFNSPDYFRSADSSKFFGIVAQTQSYMLSGTYPRSVPGCPNAKDYRGLVKCHKANLKEKNPNAKFWVQISANPPTNSSINADEMYEFAKIAIEEGADGIWIWFDGTTNWVKSQTVFERIIANRGSCA